MKRNIQAEIDSVRNDLDMERSRVLDQNRIQAIKKEHVELYSSQQGIPLSQLEVITQETKDILTGYVGSLSCAGVKPEESIKYGRHLLGRSWGDVCIKGWYFEPGGVRSVCRGEKEERVKSFITLDLLISNGYYKMLDVDGFYSNFDDEHIQGFVVHDLAQRGVNWAGK